MAEIASKECWMRNASHILIPEIFAMAYHSLVGSKGAVRRADSGMG